jgi:hypothetical protein
LQSAGIRGRLQIAVFGHARPAINVGLGTESAGQEQGCGKNCAFHLSLLGFGVGQFSDGTRRTPRRMTWITARAGCLGIADPSTCRSAIVAELARGHVLDHALAKRADNLGGHR